MARSCVERWRNKHTETQGFCVGGAWGWMMDVHISFPEGRPGLRIGSFSKGEEGTQGRGGGSEHWISGAHQGKVRSFLHGLPWSSATPHTTIQ